MAFSNGLNSSLAVLIDADNANPAIVEGLLEEVAKLGIASVKRIYGDWTTPNLGQWKQVLLEHSIQPIQQFRYFIFYNGERPHQSLGQKTPDVVYQTGIGGGAVIVNKYPRADDGTPVERSGTGVPSSAESAPEVSAEAKPGQRRPAALEVECVA